MAALERGDNELYVSPQIESLLGFSQKEWLEDPILWYRQLHPDDRVRWHTEFAQTCAAGQAFPRRVPLPGPRRPRGLGPRRGPGGARRAGQSPLPPGHRLRHHGAEAGRGGPPQGPRRAGAAGERAHGRAGQGQRGACSRRSRERQRIEEELRRVNADLVARPPAGRGGQPGQEHVPRQHEPRAAHAPERHHRLQRAAPGAGGPEDRRRTRRPTWRRSAGRASTC